MATPTMGDLTRLKRLGRYLKGKPRLQQWFVWQPKQEKLVTYSDADWAGCKQTRKSTTGGCIMVGAHSIKSWSRTQSLIALSSGESELYASLKAAAETLGVLSMAKDLNWNLKGEVWGDASAALGIIHRKGLGKTRHIQTGLLWIQQTAAEQRLRFHKVLGTKNPADLFTKYLDESTNNTHTTTMGFQYAEGRAEEAPKLHVFSQAQYHESQYSTEWEQWKWLKYLSDDRRGRHNRGKTRQGTLNSVTKGCQHNKQLTDLGQVVLQGYNRQVQGSNGLNSAQPDRPWGSTQTVPIGHNRVKRPCLVGRVTGTQTRGIAHMPTVVPREGMIHLLSEKGPFNQRMPGTRNRRGSWSQAKKGVPLLLLLLPQQLGHKETRNIQTHTSQRNQNQDDANCLIYKPNNSHAADGTTYNYKGLTIGRATPLNRIQDAMQSKTMQTYLTRNHEGSGHNYTTKVYESMKSTVTGEHKTTQHNSWKAYEGELNAQSEKFTTTTTRCDVQFCLGTISNLCFAPDVNSGLRLWGGARDIDINRTYRYFIEQVTQTLISQPKLTNRSVAGEQAECTTNVYLAQD